MFRHVPVIGPTLHLCSPEHY